MILVENLKAECICICKSDFLTGVKEQEKIRGWSGKARIRCISGDYSIIVILSPIDICLVQIIWGFLG